MKSIRLVIILLSVLVPLVFGAFSFAQTSQTASKEGKPDWSLDNITRLEKAVDFRPDISSLWPGDKIPDGGYVLPGSKLQLHYRSWFNMYLTMLLYSPDGKITPLFTNSFNRVIPTKTPILKYNLQIPKNEGNAAVMLIASPEQLDKDTIAQVAKNPDAEKFPDKVFSVSFSRFKVVDYVNTMVPMGQSGVPQYTQQGGGGGYNAPDYHSGGGYNQGGGNNQGGGGGNYGGPVPQQGQYGPNPIPLSQMGTTYYFYPNGMVSQNYYPYYNPYYYYRPQYYGFPGNMYYVPQGQRYYIRPQGNGVRTNLYDCIFDANFKYGEMMFGDGQFIGGKFYFDGKNPKRGLTFRFPSRTYVSHEGNDGNWEYVLPGDFDFYLNGQPLPIYGGGQNNPFLYIPLQGLVMNGLNEFRLLPRPNENYYGIGPIDISADIRF